MLNTKMDTDTIVGLIVLLILVIVFSPFVAIWCVNTLFGTVLEYSFLNWFCVFLLLGLVRGASTSTIK